RAITFPVLWDCMRNMPVRWQRSCYRSCSI
ncbi:hypothetical protein AVDCRST_MAG94-6187, partial [uncultured Leptolyngbya sp.]